MNRQEATQRWHQKWHAYLTIVMGIKPDATHYEMRPRYMEQCADAYGVCWQTLTEHDLRRGRRMAYVEDVSAIGLRLVGRVEAESYGTSNGTWAKRETCGWYTNNHGESFTDGDGLCWGIVYQLPSSNHGKERLRFVAGYVMGGWDKGVTLDFGHVFTDVRATSTERSTEVYGALEASKHADEMARDAAEEEREYQRAYEEEQDALEAADEDEEDDDASEAA